MITRFIGNILGTFYKKRLRGRDRLFEFVVTLIGIDRSFVFKNQYGVKLSLTPDDAIDRFILENGYYESEVFEAIKETIVPGSVFWDVGANAGIHSITLAQISPDTLIFAFEPSTKEIFRIQRSAHFAGVGFEVLPIGLSDHEGLSRFYIREDNSGRNSLIPKGDGSGYTATTVALARGDHLCFDLDFEIPTVIKIDVEGAEHRVLEGMSRILQHPNCQRIVIEGPADFADGLNQTAKLLVDAGFRISALQRNENSHHNLENFCADKVKSSSAAA